jgi:hypothetical protein
MAGECRRGEDSFSRGSRQNGDHHGMNPSNGICRARLESVTSRGGPGALSSAGTDGFFLPNNIFSQPFSLLSHTLGMSG